MPSSPSAAPARAAADRSLTARDLALIAAFCALIVALMVVKVPVGPAPIVLQNLGVILAGAVLGARRGFLSVLLFVVLAVAGLPVLASGVRGLAVFTGPTVGFVLSYPLVALVTGWLVERSGSRRTDVLATVGASLVGGILVCYALGIPGMAWRSPKLDLAGAAAFSTTFLPGDLAKAVLAGAVAAAVHKAIPDLLPTRRR